MIALERESANKEPPLQRKPRRKKTTGRGRDDVYGVNTAVTGRTNV